MNKSEQFLERWYALLKERDPHHFEEWADNDYEWCGDYEYTFKMFKNSPMARAGSEIFVKMLEEE